MKSEIQLEIQSKILLEFTGFLVSLKELRKFRPAGNLASLRRVLRSCRDSLIVDIFYDFPPGGFLPKNEECIRICNVKLDERDYRF